MAFTRIVRDLVTVFGVVFVLYMMLTAATVTVSAVDRGPKECEGKERIVCLQELQIR